MGGAIAGTGIVGPGVDGVDRPGENAPVEGVRKGSEPEGAAAPVIGPDPAGGAEMRRRPGAADPREAVVAADAREAVVETVAGVATLVAAEVETPRSEAVEKIVESG